MPSNDLIIYISTLGLCGLQSGSVPNYTNILVKLMEIAKESTLVVNAKLPPRRVTLEEYRRLVAESFGELTKEYLEGLPDAVEYGAFISLKGYGRRNRDDIIRRILNGKLPEVEEAHSQLQRSDGITRR